MRNYDNLGAMLHLFAQAADQTTQIVTTSTQTTVQAWIEPAIVVALVFALAGTIFVSIYFLRARRKQAAANSAA